MKKAYIAPAIKVVKLNTERMIAQSVTSDLGIGYGGIDLGGGIVIPGVKQDNPLLNNVWW
ncbi:MAG: hypothetical protein K6F20_04765 [Bacteroidaceae bacterium]|nr:hypothetical protein [Bacteroidaceae bacterium]